MKINWNTVLIVGTLVAVLVAGVMLSKGSYIYAVLTGQCSKCPRAEACYNHVRAGGEMPRCDRQNSN